MGFREILLASFCIGWFLLDLWYMDWYGRLPEGFFEQLLLSFLFAQMW